MAGRVRQIVAELDPDLPVYDLAPLDEAIQQATWAFRLFGIQFSVFGGLALFLATVGLYGVMAFSVSQRRQEMGVRMALGAERTSIIRLVLRRGGIQLGVGMVLGLAIGATMGGPMRYVLYGVEAGDPRVYASIVLTLLASGFLACVLPARAATRVDPVEAMRGE
jgi:ABC-type antimicrobial peptide transport system permease subunit